MGVDRTFNLSALFATVTVFKKLAVVRGTTQETTTPHLTMAASVAEDIDPSRTDDQRPIEDRTRFGFGLLWVPCNVMVNTMQAWVGTSAINVWRVRRVRTWNVAIVVYNSYHRTKAPAFSSRHIWWLAVTYLPASWCSMPHSQEMHCMVHGEQGGAIGLAR